MDLSQSDLAASFAQLRARWARRGRRVRQLAAKADEISTSRPGRRVRGRGRQITVLENIREEVGYHDAWARWSTTADELAEIVEEIMVVPAHNFSDLTVKFDALLWLLLSDDAVLDVTAVRQVRRFGKELRDLIDSASKSRT